MSVDERKAIRKNNVMSRSHRSMLSTPWLKNLSIVFTEEAELKISIYRESVVRG
jgi:hypothetical protein